MMGRVVCAGHVNWDLTLHVDRLPDADGEAVVTDQTQSGGGSASNVAAVITGLGCESYLLGSVGDDEFGLLARRALEKSGVDCTHLQTVEEAETTVKYLIVDETGEVMVLANEGANEAYDASDLVDETLQDASYLHLTNQDPETARILATRARSAGVPVSVDPGRRLGDREFGSVLELADIVFLNEREARIAREDGFTDDGATTVVKRGDGGAAIHDPEFEASHPGYDVDPVNTAGAGDAFAAGYLAARLEGQSPTAALAVANACGALATTTRGARTEISWADIHEQQRRA